MTWKWAIHSTRNEKNRFRWHSQTIAPDKTGHEIIFLTNHKQRRRDKYLKLYSVIEVKDQWTYARFEPERFKIRSATFDNHTFDFVKPMQLSTENAYINFYSPFYWLARGHLNTRYLSEISC